MKAIVLQVLKEKRKSLVATIAVVTIAGFSFVAGRALSGNASSAAVQAEATDTEKKPETPSRAPASEKKKPEPKKNEGEDEREVDEDEVQIALQSHSPKRASHASPDLVAEALADEEHEIELKIDHKGHKENKKDKAAAHSEHQDEHKGEHKNAHATAEAKATDPHANHGFFGRLVHTYASALESVHDKIIQLHHSEEENRKLRLENAHLRVKLETQNFECRVSEEKRHAEKVGSKLNAQTGTRVGRTLASIQYQIPENLLPEQLHALGVSYVKANDFERGAAILTFLTELEGDSTFKTPENFMMTGLSWYKLENFKTANDFFDRALKDPTSSRKVKSQARIWKAIIAQRSRRHGEAQEWLRRTLESDPQSKEAHWVNPQEGDRKPASKKRAAAHNEDARETHH